LTTTAKSLEENPDVLEL